MHVTRLCMICKLNCLFTNDTALVNWVAYSQNKKLYVKLSIRESFRHTLGCQLDKVSETFFYILYLSCGSCHWSFGLSVLPAYFGPSCRIVKTIFDLFDHYLSVKFIAYTAASCVSTLQCFIIIIFLDFFDSLRQ